MTAHDPSLSSERKGVLGWLGIGRSQSSGTAPLSTLAQQLRSIAPGSRSDQIASIAEFLAKHDLDVGPCALAVAFDYVTRSDPLLVRLIDERELIGQPAPHFSLPRIDDDGTEQPIAAHLMPRALTDRMLGYFADRGIHYFLQTDDAVYASPGIGAAADEFFRQRRAYLRCHSLCPRSMRQPASIAAWRRSS